MYAYCGLSVIKYFFILFSFQSSGLMSSGDVDPQSLDKSYWINRVGEVRNVLSFSHTKCTALELNVSST